MAPHMSVGYRSPFIDTFCGASDCETRIQYYCTVQCSADPNEVQGLRAPRGRPGGLGDGLTTVYIVPPLV